MDKNEKKTTQNIMYLGVCLVFADTHTDRAPYHQGNKSVTTTNCVVSKNL